MRLWSEFYDLAMPDLPGCPSIMLDNALRQSAITFFEQSLAWKYDHPSISVVPGVAEYAFSPPAEAAIHAIVYAALDGTEIETHASEASLAAASWRNPTGVPRYVLAGPTSLKLIPEPGAAASLTLTVALKPSRTSTGIDDMQFDEFREAIVHGALARLMLSPKKPYTSVQLAAYHQQQFAIKTAAAGVRVARSYTRARLRTAILKRG